MISLLGMLKLSYNLSLTLKKHLQSIESSRKEILTASINPKVELRLRWEAMVDRIYFALGSGRSHLTKKETIKLLSRQRNKLTAEEKEVINLRNAFTYINQNWLISRRNITFRVVEELLDMLKIKRGVSYTAERVNSVLTYLQTGNDHPFVQSAIIQDQIDRGEGDMRLYALIASLMGYIFIYKYGYDIRGLLILEGYWSSEAETINKIKLETEKSGNLTGWLEYYTQCVDRELERIKKEIEDIRFHTETGASFWELSSRQKEIIGLLEEPDKTITNRVVQKEFGVSQITASRDLSRLAIIGLLYPHGKGRSVYYTRV